MKNILIGWSSKSVPDIKKLLEGIDETKPVKIDIDLGVDFNVVMENNDGQLLITVEAQEYEEQSIGQYDNARTALNPELIEDRADDEGMTPEAYLNKIIGESK